jgi:hypothetical protein
MTMVTEYDWESDTFTHHAEHGARAAWRAAVAQVADNAREKLPECSGRIDRAVALVLAGDVEVLADGTARVASQSNGTTAYQVVNGHCECRDFDKAPHGFCKHRLGAAIARRAQELLQAQESGQVAPEPAPVEPGPPVPAAALLPESLLPYVVHIKGKAFIQYGGLLTLAHSRGLVSLKVDFISVTSELALARAEAVFADGRVYAECADATPGNVGAQVRPHFPRLALTRSKARCLRDALGITMVAVEELSGED